MTRHRVLAALATIVLLSTLAISHASAHEPHPGLQFSIAIDGVPGCDTRHGDATCELPIGSTFQLDVNLDSLPNDIPGYEGLDVYLEYAGVVPTHDASNAAWPDCGFPAASYDRPSVIGFGCAIGVAAIGPAAPSTYTGLIGTNGFTCDQSGSIALLHGETTNDSYTDLVEDARSDEQTPGFAAIHSEGIGTRETINITCAEEPTPTSTPPPVLPPAGVRPSGSPSIPIWLIPALLGIAAIALASLATRWRRTT